MRLRAEDEDESGEDEDEDEDEEKEEEASAANVRSTKGEIFKLTKSLNPNVILYICAH